MTVSTRTTPAVMDEARIQELVNNAVNSIVTTAVERIRQEFVMQRPESSNARRERNLDGGMRGNSQFSRVTKIEFPKFGGEDVKGWLFKCEQLFKVDNIARDYWESYKPGFNFLKRFDVAYDDPLGEVKKLKQTSIVQDYIDAFDRLLYRINLPEDQCISFFLVGLSNEIELAVRMFKPRTLAEVYGLCKLENRVIAAKQRPKPPILPTPRYQSQFPNTSPKPMALPTPNANWRTKPVNSSSPTPFRKQLTQKELEEKRAKNQCFYCDRRYTPGHKCSGQVFSLEVLGEDIQELIETNTKEDTSGELIEETEELIQYSPHISLNAINGTSIYQTMRISGHVGKHTLHILVDCGSTHNFLDLDTANKLGCQLVSICPLQVEVAGGNKMICKYMCKGFTWRCRDVEFQSDVMIIPLGGCEMIQTPSVELSFMVLCIYPSTTLHMIEATESYQVPKKITELLHQYEDVFVVPTTLPPTRSCGHQISLKEGTIPINSRPYRHPPTQKDAIEVMKDGSWRMCIDYRKLNNATIKDKFHIPVIEELIDELQGSQYFTKLDLISCYHQIRMQPNDVEKTAFKTHEGHYEFLVMPFGLTNAPSTFQALMNSVFKSFLRRFVLVFYDDISVYSPDLETHVWHLELVLQVLRQHTLYAKQSKCVFGTKKVEYLGHVITKEGVATDKSKIEAMQQWPTPTNLKQLRGFLGLTGYYRRWSDTAQAAFDQLKQAMTEASVLKLSDFNELFILETNASCGGFEQVEGRIMDSCQADTDLQKLIKDLETNPQSHKHYTWVNGQLRRKGKLVVGNNEELKQQLLQFFHSDPSGVHSGVQATLKRITCICYWRKLRQQIKVFAAICKVCQANKLDLSSYPGLLQPLPILKLVWSEISMDFIKGLPSSHGKSAIFVIVDRLNGQTEVVNRCLECYLRCISREKPKAWAKWVSLAEYWYNTTYDTSLKTTPYEVLYGQPPPNPIAYVQGQVDTVDRTLAARESMIQLLQFYLERSQQRMKVVVDAKRSDREFDIGQWVYLKLQPHCHTPTMAKTRECNIMINHNTRYKNRENNIA
ncbi:reverse transcriptase [Tanacetum coccineum]